MVELDDEIDQTGSGVKPLQPHHHHPHHRSDVRGCLSGGGTLLKKMEDNPPKKGLDDTAWATQQRDSVNSDSLWNIRLSLNGGVHAPFPAEPTQPATPTREVLGEEDESSTPSETDKAVQDLLFSSSYDATVPVGGGPLEDVTSEINLSEPDDTPGLPESVETPQDTATAATRFPAYDSRQQPHSGESSEDTPQSNPASDDDTHAAPLESEGRGAREQQQQRDDTPGFPEPGGGTPVLAALLEAPPTEAGFSPEGVTVGASVAGLGFASPSAASARQRSDVFGFPVMREAAYRKWQAAEEKRALYDAVSGAGGWGAFLRPGTLGTLSWYGTPGYYEALKWLSKRHRLLQHRRGDILQSFYEIERDIQRTYPGRLAESRLRTILQAYALRNAEVGYCQGMNYVTALLTRAVPSEEEAFWLLCYISEEVVPDYYRGLGGVLVDLQVLGWMLSKLEGCLWNHLTGLGLSCADIFTDHLICVFSYGMPAEAVLAMWREIFKSDQPRIYILRLTLGLLSLLKADLLSTTDVSSAVEVLQEGRGSLYAAQRIIEVAAHTTELLSDDEIERERLCLLETESCISGIPFDAEREREIFCRNASETQEIIASLSQLWGEDRMEETVTPDSLHALVESLRESGEGLQAEAIATTHRLLTTPLEESQVETPLTPSKPLFIPDITVLSDVTFNQLLLSFALLRCEPEPPQAVSLRSAVSPMPSTSDCMQEGELAVSPDPNADADPARASPIFGEEEGGEGSDEESTEAAVGYGVPHPQPASRGSRAGSAQQPNPQGTPQAEVMSSPSFAPSHGGVYAGVGERGRTPSEEILFIRRSASGGRQGVGAEGQRPYFVPDEEAADCVVCRQKFTWLTRRRHHCRHCGEVVCGVCSPSRIPIPRMNFPEPVRVCNVCLPGLVVSMEQNPAAPVAPMSPLIGHGGTPSNPRSSLDPEPYAIPSPTSSVECHRGADLQED